MKIGFPNNPTRDIFGEIDWIGSNGFDFIDLFLEADQADLDHVDPRKVREAIKRAGLEAATGHLAYYLLIGSPLRPIREAAVQTAMEYLDAFALVGVPIVTVHANWPPSFFPPSKGLEWQVESLQKLVSAARERGVKLMYEPIDTRADTPENVRAVLDRIPEMNCHLDLGHCNLFGRKPDEMIRQFADRLSHIHLHDNNGMADLHLPPGAGNIDWRAVVRAFKDVGYEGTITLEVFSHNRELVLVAKRMIEDLWAGHAS